jgi:hypothetical protein
MHSRMIKINKNEKNEIYQLHFFYCDFIPDWMYK